MLTETTTSAVNEAVDAAAKAAPGWAASDRAKRIDLLNGLAARLEDAKDELVQLADEETHLGAGRLNGELARTAFQLRGFADQVAKGVPFTFVDDPAVAGPPPSGHPHMVRIRQPVGPVAMFSASNFPFAFSVLGGDTASALAAGCPVVVKAHPGHPRLSRRVHELAVEVLVGLGLPAGLLGFVEGGSIAVGVQLIRHPSIAAAAFTGSVRGGLALQAEANSRPRPIPFYGELGSVNPLILLPDAAIDKEADLALTLAQSITGGTGQFCTSPGIVVVFKSASTERFLTALGASLKQQSTHAMLTQSIRKGFDDAVLRLSGHPGVRPLLSGGSEEDQAPKPFLARTDAKTFVCEA
jgi:acyl-CoA reductase-like NAD-dependent aldehyde dehydrogenase